MALLLRVASVVDADLLVRVVQLPVLILILFIEIDNEKRVLKVDEEVAHIRVLLRLFLISDDVKVAVSILVSPINFLLELLFVVATRDVLDA